MINVILPKILRQSALRRQAAFNKAHHKQRLGKLIVLLVMLLLVHSAAMVWLENLTIEDALWLSLTTATTVGYGDLHAQTVEGRIATTLLLYFFGIALLAQLTAEFFEYRIAVRDARASGNWRLNYMQDHLLILNAPDHSPNCYLQRLVSQLKKTPILQDCEVVILTTDFQQGLPQTLIEMGCQHYSGSAENEADLLAVNAGGAKYTILLARDADATISDSVTFDVVSRLQDLSHQSLLLAEVVDDLNRNRIVGAGAAITVRPVRAYPELIVRSLEAPGTEAVLEDFFTHEGDHMIKVAGDFTGVNWLQFVTDMQTKQLGLPIGYIASGKVVTNPVGLGSISADAVICLVKDRSHNIESVIRNLAEQLST